MESGDGGVINWQNARYKAEILGHPLYEQLLSAHVACLRIATPVDQLPRIDAQLAQSPNVVAKYSALSQALVGDDKELDQFMVRQSSLSVSVSVSLLSCVSSEFLVILRNQLNRNLFIVLRLIISSLPLQLLVVRT